MADSLLKKYFFLRGQLFPTSILLSNLPEKKAEAVKFPGLSKVAESKGKMFTEEPSHKTLFS